MGKFLVVVAVLILLLGGAGGGAWWFWLREPPAATTAQTAPPAPKLEMFEFDPVVLPLIQEGRVTRHAKLMIVLEVTAGIGPPRVMAVMPRLRDAFFTELYRLYDKRLLRERADAVAILERRLLEIGAAVLGPDMLHAVLLSGLEPPKERQG